MKRALVVEDNPEARSALQELLAVSGFEVEAVEDAEQALTVLLTRLPNVVVLDLRAGDGLEVIKRIKAENEGVFVAVFSGWNHLEPAARAAGADAYVVKPDVDRLQRLLARLSGSELTEPPRKKDLADSG